MTIQKQLPTHVVVEKRGKVWLVPAVAISSMLLSANALAADGDITYPTIDFSAIPFGVWIAAVMAFVLMAGMAFIGLAALISVMRKSRGAVR